MDTDTEEKIKKIKEKISSLPPKEIDNILNKIEYTERIMKPAIKTVDKYDVLLTVVNRLLANMNYPQISDLLDFKDVKRADLITESNDAIIMASRDILDAAFTKHESGLGVYGRKSLTATVLKNTCKTVGLTLVGKRREISEAPGCRTSYWLYTIFSK